MRTAFASEKAGFAVPLVVHAIHCLERNFAANLHLDMTHGQLGPSQFLRSASGQVDVDVEHQLYSLSELGCVSCFFP